MDWERAIVRNANAILSVLATLFNLMSTSQLKGAGFTIPRHVWRTILIALRPVEAAARRLIVIAARELTVMLRLGRAVRPGSFVPFKTALVTLAPRFNLFDPLKDFASSADDDAADSCGQDGSLYDSSGDEPVNADPLFNRLRALRLALDDVPKQALRLARFNARRDVLMQAGKPVRLSPIRPGLPPGWSERRQRGEIGQILQECHLLVRYLENGPVAVDTS